MLKKVCGRCKIEKDITIFYKNKRKKDGYQNYCKCCMKKSNANSFQKNKKKRMAKGLEWQRSEKGGKYHSDYYKHGSKRKREVVKQEVIPEMYQQQHAEQFTSFMSETQEERTKAQRERYQNNKSVILEKQKEYRKRSIEKDPEFLVRERERNRKYKHTRKYKDKANARKRQRLKNDPEYKLKENLRNRVRKFLQGAKSTTTESLIGCTWEKLFSHIENQFHGGMSWQNQGEWEIDHIIPCNAFKDELHLESNQRVLCWFQNLQPLWGVDNRVKGGKYKEEDKQDLIRRYNDYGCEVADAVGVHVDAVKE